MLFPVYNALRYGDKHTRRRNSENESIYGPNCDDAIFDCESEDHDAVIELNVYVLRVSYSKAFFEPLQDDFPDQSDQWDLA